MTNEHDIKSRISNNKITKEEFDDYLMKKNEPKKVQENIRTTLGTIKLPIKKHAG